MLDHKFLWEHNHLYIFINLQKKIQVILISDIVYLWFKIFQEICNFSQKREKKNETILILGKQHLHDLRFCL